MITLGKRRTHSAAVQARAFCLQDSVVTKLFGPLAKRYRDRPGGYTRIHKFGNRRGDNAPHAILELVDNPRDLRMALTARAVGWDLLSHRLGANSASGDISSEPEEAIRASLDRPGQSKLRPITVQNLEKIAKFGQIKNKITSLATDSSNWMVSNLRYLSYVSQPPPASVGCRLHSLFRHAEAPGGIELEDRGIPGRCFSTAPGCWSEAISRTC
jgi:large subunit ribosomal protein L17